MTKDTMLGVAERDPEIYTADELKTFFKACWPMNMRYSGRF